MKRILTTIFLTTLLAGATVLAQGGMGLGGEAPGATMAKFFGKNTSFSANAEITMTSPNSEPIGLDMNFSVLEGWIRTDMDLTKEKGGKAAPNADKIKQTGLDKNVMIIRPDKKFKYSILPGLHAYAEETLSDKQLADAAQEYKLQKTSLGKETIDGHACEKNKIVATNDKGQKNEAIVWNAADLKDFPVQIQMAQAGNSGTVTLKFKGVKLEKPDAALFEPPAGFTKYPDSRTMMNAEMLKLINSGAIGGPPAFKR